MSDSPKQSGCAGSALGAALLAFAAAGCVSGVTDTSMMSASAGATSMGTAGGGGALLPDGDPGRVGIHRLNNTEYDNTVRDLFGTTLQPAVGFLAEEGLNFDNTASALGMTVAQYEGYLKAAGDVMTAALATPAQAAKFLTCMPTTVGDACARQIIGAFGMKIYRRPLEVAEVDRAMKVYDADVTRNKNGTEAIGQALRAMLSAASFLYRIEYDADPKSTTPHPISSYEIASRLSYLHWSSMPDDALFDAAKAGQLQDPATLETTVDRLIADGKSRAFVESFAGQWLSIRKLSAHTVTDQVFPTWTPELTEAMAAESYLWFQEFLTKDRSLNDWFSADFNFVNDTLAKHYGMPLPGKGAELVKVEVTTDQRVGFLGLASFLTQTSFPSRTAPTLRGAWVLSELLCAPPAPPPGDVPKLEESAKPEDAMTPTGSENVRERLEKHRAAPACRACHNSLDPLGLGLERFDGIGRYRETYPNGDAIVSNGVMPDGTAFSGPQELGAIVGKDPRFSACAASKLYTYALGREIEGYDAATIANLKTKWAARGLSFRNLMKEIVLSNAFRTRHGEAE